MSEHSNPAFAAHSNAIRNQRMHLERANPPNLKAVKNERVALAMVDQEDGAADYGWSGRALTRQDVKKILRRQTVTVFICCIIALIAGLIFVLVSTPYYTARTQVLVEPTSRPAFDNQSGMPNGRVDLVELDSQVEIIKSRGLAGQAVDKLNLMNVPTFTTDSNKLEQLVSQARARLKLQPYPDTKTPAGRRLLAIDKLLKNLSALRIGNSKVVEIKYSATNPVMAATLANTFAQEYLADRQQVERSANQRRLSWLKQRVMELQQQTIASSLAVQSFRNESNLQVVQGQPAGTQDVAALIGQLKRARAATTQAAARYERFRQMLESKRKQMVEIDFPDERKLNDMAGKLSIASVRLSEMNSLTRSDHTAIVKMQKEVKQIEGAMKQEIERKAASYQSEYELAKSREQELAAYQRKLLSNLTPANRAVILLDLEREAETYRSMYVNFSTRLQEASQKQSFVTHHGRVVSSALQPVHPSFPRVKLVLIMSLALGMIFGITLGAYREWSSAS